MIFKLSSAMFLTGDTLGVVFSFLPTLELLQTCVLVNREWLDPARQLCVVPSSEFENQPVFSIYHQILATNPSFGYANQFCLSRHVLSAEPIISNPSRGGLYNE